MYSYTRLSQGVPHLVALHQYLSITRLFDECIARPAFAADRRLLRTFDLLADRLVVVSRGMLRGYLRLIVPLGAPTAVTLQITGEAVFLVQHAGLSFTGTVEFPMELASIFVLDTYGMADANICANAPAAYDARYCWSLCVNRRRRNGAVTVVVRPGGCLLLSCARDALDTVRTQLASALGAWQFMPAPVDAHGYAITWAQASAGEGGAYAVSGLYCETPRGEPPRPGGFSLSTLGDVQSAIDRHLQASADEARARAVHNSPSFLTSSDHEAIVEQNAGFFDMDVGFFDSPERLHKSRRDEEDALCHVRFDTRDPAQVRVAWDGVAGWFFLVAPARAAVLGYRAIIMFVHCHRFYRLVVPDAGELQLLAHEVSAAATHRIEERSERLGVDVVCQQLRSLLGAESGPHLTMTLDRTTTIV